jgi:predicted nucleotidyltransferase
MDAGPILARVAEVLRLHGMEAVLIGNAAAALRGAPVTTIDVDFMFRRTPQNLKKLRAIASELGAMVLREYYPASGLHRIYRDDDGLQLDFMAVIDGIHSFEGLRSRATPIRINGETLLVASLADIIKSKRAAGRPKDRAVLEDLEKTLAETSRHPPRST